MTDYQSGHGAGIRNYVKKARQPMPPAGGNHAAAQREERETTITVATIGFQTRRLPGEDRWAREIIPSKVVE